MSYDLWKMIMSNNDNKLSKMKKKNLEIKIQRSKSKTFGFYFRELSG